MADDAKSSKVKVVWMVSDTARQIGDKESVDREVADRLIANNQAREV